MVSFKGILVNRESTSKTTQKKNHVVDQQFLQQN